jgi:hypothetical protein
MRRLAGEPRPYSAVNATASPSVTGLMCTIRPSMVNASEPAMA